MLPELDDSDWKSVFHYADGSEGSPTVVTDGSCTSDCFDRESVARVIASALGENDGAQWIIVVLLKDGRYALVRAGCDYTGWG